MGLFGKKENKTETIESLNKNLKVWKGATIGLAVGLIGALIWAFNK